MIGFGTPASACADAATPGPVTFAPTLLTLDTHEGRGSCTFSRASSATVKQASHIWVEVGSHVHRVWGGTYAGGVWSAVGVTTAIHHGVTWYDQNGFGLLIEPSRTNYVYYSRRYSGCLWSVNNRTVSQTAVGIDGIANSAVAITQTTWYAVNQTEYYSLSGNVVASFFVKKDVTASNYFGAVSHGASTYISSVQENLAIDNGANSSFSLVGTPTFSMSLVGDWWHIRHGGSFTGHISYGFYPAIGGSTRWTWADQGQTPTVICDNMQVEVGLGATTPIFTTSSLVTRAGEACKWPAAGNYSDTSGTLICEMELPFLQSAAFVTTGTMGLVSLSGSATSLAYYDFAAQAFKTTDGTNTSSVAAVPTCGKRWRIAVRWKAATNEVQIGAKNISDSGSWSWSSVATYDGDFASDGYISLGVGIPESIVIANVMILSAAKTTTEIEVEWP
ncbi:MAG: hypothetical protein HQL73_09320 [Magnetococcales bacterium]|nr:hypothetical protein [Magnetococcales bacterium]